MTADVGLAVSGVVVSVPAFLVALLFVDGVVWPVVLGGFCGFAAATVLNATDVMARWSRRDPTSGEVGTGGRNDRRENGRVFSPTAERGA